MSKSQTVVDKNVRIFLGDMTIKTTEDLVDLKNLVLRSLKFRPYNKKTKKQADKIQWKRTASQILKDGYVYQDKACSDLVLVFITLCKAAGIEARLVKLKSITDNDGHSIAEVKIKSIWYRIDPSSKDSRPFKGALTRKSIWNKKFQVYKKGKDLWALGLDSIKAEDKITK